MKKQALDQVSEIRFGLYARPELSGSASYLQVRHFDEDGRLIHQLDEFVTLPVKNASHFLQDGDVLFVGKGTRLFSWCYREPQLPAVASSIFFVLRPNTTIIYPEYLSAILNAPQTKKTFLQIGSGTNIFSIRKSELGAFEVPIPAMPEQKKIAALAELHQQEVVLAQQLIERKKNLYTAIISKLIK
jgi:restriction endonuclease S subunit